jgi:hypothetical protein
MRSIALVSALAFTVLGCFSETSAPHQAPDAAPDAPATDASACSAAPSGPTQHAADIAANETWTAAGSPHVVTQPIQVVAGAKLTIEPCAVVQLAPDASIDLTPTSAASLDAVGTATQPIQFVAQTAMPWSYLRVSSPSTATLAWVTLSGGGSDSKFAHGTTLVIDGTQQGVAQPVVTANHVAITRSAGIGVLLEASGAFSDSSSDLTITQCGSAADPYPVRVGFDAVGGIPAGQYTGNASDAIFVDPGVAGRIKASVTMHERGLPYRMAVTQSSVYLVSADSASAPPAVLTIEPGVKLAMEKNAQIQIGVGPMAPGSIVAAGTAAQPIVFTSAAGVPAPGDWGGLLFGGTSAPANVLDHSSIEYAGGPSGATGYSCLPTGDNDNAAIIMLGWIPPAAFLTNSAIVKCAANGVIRGWAGPGPSFLASNTFDVAECPETLNRDALNGCPTTITCQ